MRKYANSRYGLLAVVPLSAGVIVEGLRLITNSPWRGFQPWISHSVSALLALLWATTALAILLRHRSARWASVAFVFGIGAPLLMMAHAFVTRVVGTPAGMLYLVGAATAGFFTFRTFSHGELESLPGRNAASRKQATA